MAGSKQQSYADRIIERARELRESDAFALREHTGFAIPTDTVKEQRRFTKRSIRQTIVLCVAIIVVIMGMSLCLPYNTGGSQYAGVVYSPADVASCWALWFQTTIMPLFDSTIANRSTAMIAQFMIDTNVAYWLVIERGAVTLLLLALGFMLAVSGMLFQTTFRNPLATPTMLGVSDGVTVGYIIFACLGYTAASDNMPLYLLLAYGFGALAVVVVLGLSRAVGGKRFNVFDMLLLGTVICQLLGGVINYITNFGMDTTTWEHFYDIQQSGDAMSDPLTWAIVVVLFIVCAVPLFVYRFKLNLLAFSEEETRLMGSRPTVLRAFALVLGSIMQLAAIASIGQVAMLSLAVPFVVRYLMPSEARYQLLGNFLLGSIALLACYAVMHFAVIGLVPIPLGTIVSVLIVPFFIWAVALQSNKWGD